MALSRFFSKHVKLHNLIQCKEGHSYERVPYKTYVWRLSEHKIYTVTVGLN